MKKAVFGNSYYKQYQKFKQNPINVYNRLAQSLREKATKEGKSKIYNQLVKEFGIKKANIEYCNLFGEFYGQDE